MNHFYWNIFYITLIMMKTLAFNLLILYIIFFSTDFRVHFKSFGDVPLRRSNYSKKGVCS